MEIEVKNGFIHIKAPIEERASKTGKNLVIASTNGNVRTAVLHKGKPITVGLNAYIPIA